MTGDFENHSSALQKTQGMSFASEKTKEYLNLPILPEGGEWQQ